MLDTLSDLGFVVVDNLPVDLLSNFLEFAEKNAERYARCALLLDIKEPESIKTLLASTQNLQNASSGQARFELLFVDCDTERIINRYSETRRPHPGFRPELDKRLEDTVQREREFLMPLKERATFVLDTTRFNIHQLRREVKSFVDIKAVASSGRMRINLLSFGYKHGVPIDCDLVMDVRFLPNPYFCDHLREKCGSDREVFDYVIQSEDAKGFLRHFEELLSYLIPRYISEGKSYLTIGIGCTGGRHRSVSISEQLASTLKAQNLDVSVKHRDIERYAHLQRE